MEMDRAVLAFIPSPGVGHLAPMVEFAKVLTTRDERISVTVFIINLPFQSKINSYTQTLQSTQPPQRVRFVHLSLDESVSEHLRTKPRSEWMPELVRIHKPRVMEFLSSEPTHPLAGFVVDLFRTSFTDVAAEFGVPSYVFFTSSVGTLGLLFHLQSLYDDENRDITEFKDSDAELQVPGFQIQVPAKVWPYSIFDKDSSGSLIFASIPRKLRKFKGIFVNTFAELESHALRCVSNDVSIPPIYAVGPVLNLDPVTSNDDNETDHYEAIMTWLDNQPPSSVVFLCFGSMGSFEAEQVAEIAHALELSGHRFLWSLRRPPLEGKMDVPTEYENLNDVLPDGFQDRTKEVGRVIGWAPQVAVLSHPAVGGFVSHCGWNSVLESLWYGVPVATWPLYAEQQLNAFELVKELGLAIEIKLDYRRDNPEIVTANEIEKGIKQLMEGSESTEIRNKVKAMGRKSRMAVVEDGSSYVAVGHFIEEVLSIK